MMSAANRYRNGFPKRNSLWSKRLPWRDHLITPTRNSDPLPLSCTVSIGRVRGDSRATTYPGAHDCAFLQFQPLLKNAVRIAIHVSGSIGGLFIHPQPCSNPPIRSWHPRTCRTWSCGWAPLYFHRLFFPLSSINRRLLPLWQVNRSQLRRGSGKASLLLGATGQTVCP